MPSARYLEELGAGGHRARRTVCAAPALVRPADPRARRLPGQRRDGAGQAAGKNPRELAEPVAEALRAARGGRQRRGGRAGLHQPALRRRGSATRCVEARARRRARRGARGGAQAERSWSTTPARTSPSRCTSATCARPSSATRSCALLRFLGHEVIARQPPRRLGHAVRAADRRHARASATRPRWPTSPSRSSSACTSWPRRRAKADPAFADARARRAGQAAERRRREHRAVAALRRRDSRRARQDLRAARRALRPVARRERLQGRCCRGVVERLLRARDRARGRRARSACSSTTTPSSRASRRRSSCRRRTARSCTRRPTSRPCCTGASSWAPNARSTSSDSRQKQHFQQLFATVRKLGVRRCELEHVGFGIGARQGRQAAQDARGRGDQARRAARRGRGARGRR